MRSAPCAVLLIAALSLAAASTVAQESEQYRGRSLADALRMLQERGLRIVFTSAMVTPDLRVRVEPRGSTARHQLDELLAPHGLRAREGPGGTIQVVRAETAVTTPHLTATGTISGRVVHVLTAAPIKGVIVRVHGAAAVSRTDATGRFLLQNVDAGTRTIRASIPGYALGTRAVYIAPGTTITITFSLSPAASTHSEHVTVSRPRPYREDRGVASETSLDRGQLERLYGSPGDDPIRALHALPRVSAVDEFRSEFAVRGSPFRHVDLVVDGVSTHWLQHTAHRRGATGSLAMLASPVLEDATLRAGAYPHRYGDRLGPQLALTLREGSRERFKLRGAVGGTNATIFGEGPVGRSGRGSWLVAVRQSYLEWPTERAESTRTAFGFSDGLAKVVYDVRPNQQVGLSVLGGLSNIDDEDNLAPNVLGDGTNRASVVNLSWRSTFGSAVVLTQRAYVVRQRFLNKHQSGRDSDRGANEDVVYRADIARPIAGGLLEAGAQVGRTTIQEVPRSVGTNDGFAGSSWVRSAYEHFAWAATPALTLSPGLRVTDSTLVPHRTMTRWMLGEWTFRTGWTLNASAGVSHQLPDLHHTLGRAGSTRLRPERATHLDLAIERRVTDSIRWQATLFSRKEDDILREPDLYPRLVGGVITPPDPGVYANALQGSSRGIELLVDRRHATGLSGWAAYSYGKTRYTDTDRHETFWADFDQRHAFTLLGVFRFSHRASVGGTFHAGSNFPIPGYLASRDGELVAAHDRNRVRLPPHARLDLRADRGFEYFRRRLTLFVDVRNVLNRANKGLANGTVNPSTGDAIGFTDTPFRRSVSAGVLIEF
jgi:hypothetical protein